MKVQHSVVNNNKLNTVPVTNGQIVYVKDTHDLYFDIDNTRTKATDIIFVDTMQDRGAIQSPLSNKVYCVLETNCFYKYANNSWVLLGGDVTKSYVDTQDGATLTDAQNYADTNFLKKNNTTEFTPTANYHPATKKYVDDNCIPYQPFPAGLDTSHTTPDFITSIRALNLPAGSTYLGGVTLTDMPFNGNAEVEIYVYPGNVIYLTLRSANISPYMWECNSHTYRGWEAVGKAYTDNKLLTYVQNTDYATASKGGVVKIDNNFGMWVVDSGNLKGILAASTKNYSYYQTAGNDLFIGKGTLENVINSSILKTGTTAPTTSTVGHRIGQLYLNTTDNKVYQLVSIDDSDSENIIYNWQQLICDTDYATNIKGGVIITSPSWGIRTSNGFLIGNTFNISQYLGANESIIIDKGTLENIIDNSVILKGSTAPTTSTIGNRVGQLYLNTTDNSVYQLTAIDDTDPNAIVYTWQQLVTASYLTTALNNFTPSSTNTTFDNTGTDLSSTNVEDAIIELNNKIGSLNTLIEEINGE